MIINRSAQNTIIKSPNHDEWACHRHDGPLGGSSQPPGGFSTRKYESMNELLVSRSLILINQNN